MNRIHLYNMAHPLAATAKPIFIPFGEWPYDGQILQRLTPENGAKIANELNGRVARGEPGIPVYQGHPDVPALAAKYPDKGALGWVTRIEIANQDGRDGLALTVDWDRDPGAGFKWFSPYWSGSNEGGLAVVDAISSIGLVNNPNISEFRLPNESAEDQQKGKNMNRDELIALLGLPPEATDDQIKEAIAANKAAAESKAADEQKLAAANAEKEEAEKALATANSECEETKKELENERKAHAESKTALANEQAKYKKLFDLKTESEALKLANEKRQTASHTRMQLVNEIMTREHLDFDAAWAAAKAKNPEQFK